MRHMIQYNLISAAGRTVAWPKVWMLWCRISMLMISPFQCLGKLRRDHEEETKALNHHQHQRNAQKLTRSALTKLLSEVQVQKHWDKRVCLNSIQSRERKVVWKLRKTLTHNRALHNSFVLSVCLWQAVKQDLSEVFAVYFSFATELEEQSKLLLEKVKQASCSLNGHRGDEIQSKYLSVRHHRST